MAVRRTPAVVALALAGASLLHLATPASAFHRDRTGSQAAGPSLHRRRFSPPPSPLGGGGRLQPGQGSSDAPDFTSSLGFGRLATTSVLFGGPSRDPSIPLASDAEAEALAGAGSDGGDTDSVLKLKRGQQHMQTSGETALQLKRGQQQQETAAETALQLKRVQQQETAGAAASVAGVLPASDLLGGPSGAFAAWSRPSATLRVGGPTPELSSSAAFGLLGNRLIGLPAPEEGVVFTLFTRRDPRPNRIFAQSASRIRSSTSFDPRRKTKFIVHGYMADTKFQSGGHLIKDAVLSVTDANVITVDWSALDSMLYPVDALSMVPLVGATLAALIQALVVDAGLDLADVHIIGQSLGSHVAGAAGSIALGPAGKGWITGLDPAGPLLEGGEPAIRLDATDAALVEAIHTDAGMLGITQPVAHVDFIVAGGSHPYPDCGDDNLGICSHCVVWELYAFAIANPGAVLATKCGTAEEFQAGQCRGNQQTPLGLSPDRTSRGVFHLDAVGKPSEAMRAVGRGSLAAIQGFFSRMNREQPDNDLVYRC